jgi:hypothetical protein
MNQQFGKPEFLFSGFFVFLAITAFAGMAGQPPSALVSELLQDMSDQAAPVPERQDTAVSSTRVFISGVYHDLYRRVVTERGGSGAVLDKIEACSPQAGAGVIMERKYWGASACLRTGMVEAHWSGRDRDYPVDAAAPLKNLSVAGWAANRQGRIFAGFGYDAGLPLDYRGFSNEALFDTKGTVFQDPRFAHLVGGTLFARNLSLTLYETKRPLLNASARVERQSNRAFVEIPLSAVLQEVGAKAEISARRNHSAFTCAYRAISSDTAIAGEHILPAGLSGSGLRSGFRLSLGSVRFAPAAEINSWSLRLKARGYDYSDSVPYCWLDSNSVLFVNGQVSADAPWKLRAGLFGECLAGTTRLFGRFDPYVFSQFTFFDPVKYRLDTVDLRYRAVGFFLERCFGAFRRDSAGATISVSYVHSSGFMNTREYDFTFIFPRLINPQTHAFLDEEQLLFAPEVRYALLLRNFSYTVTLRQLIPVSLNGGGGEGGVPDETSVSQSVRGGTTIRVMAEYRW